MSAAGAARTRILSSGERPSIAEECRDLRFKLRQANRRLRELGELSFVLYEDLDEALREECSKRGTTVEEFRRGVRLKEGKGTRYACIRAVKNRFPDATVADLVRFFGCDRHVIYWAMKEDAQ